MPSPFRRARLTLEALEDRVTPALAAATTMISSTGLVQSEPSVAANDFGNRVVVWTHDNIGGDTDIYAQRLNPDGTKFGGEMRITSTTLRESEADVCLDNTGRFTIVYTRPNVTDTDLVVVRYNWNGQLIQTFNVPTTYFVSERDAHIACSTTAGDFVISFTRSSPTSTQDVWARTYAANGTFLREIRVSESTNLNESDSDVARQPGIGANSRFAIVYSINGSNIQARRYDGNGNRMEVSPLNIAINSWTENNPSIAANPNTFNPAAFVIVWQQQPNPLTFGSDIVARTISNFGVLSAVRFVQTDPMNDTNPTVAMRNTGDYVVAYRSTPFNSLNTFVRVSEVRAAGVAPAQFAALIVGPVFNTVGFPTITIRPDGNYFVAFALPLGSQFNSGIFGRRGTLV